MTLGLARLYPPGIAATQEFGEVAGTASGFDVGDLLGHDIFIARQVVPCAQDADRSRKAFTMLHVRKQESI